MSAGSPITAKYQDGNGVVRPIRIQPETLTLTLNGVANDETADPLVSGVPSAKVSGGRRSIGVNARLVRFIITAATPPPGYKAGSPISLPVLTPTSFAAYSRGQTGTYNLNGTDYDIAFVGKTPETIN